MPISRKGPSIRASVSFARARVGTTYKIARPFHLSETNLSAIGATTASSGRFTSITGTGLTASSAVYTDSGGVLTTTAPTSGTIGYWSRSGTTLSPSIAGDAIAGVSSIDTIGVTSTALSFAVAGTVTSTGANVMNIDGGSTGTLNLNGTSTGDILIGGGSASTGCTIVNSTGALSCTGGLTGSNFTGSSSGTNTGDVTLSAIGATPNANGATLTGQVLNLQPADGSFGGVVTTGTQTLAGAKTFSSTLTASSGLTLTTGALNLTATSGALTLSGMSASSLSFGANNVTFTSGNFNTTATGINTTNIGATTPGTGAFTTLSSTGTSNIGSGTGVVTLNSSGALNYTAASASTFTLANVANALNFDSNTLSIDALNNRVGIGTSTPGWKFTVVDNNSATASASVTNLNQTSSAANSVMTLSTGTTTGNLTRFMQFYRSATASTIGEGVGRIVLNNAGVQFTSGGADLAEWTEVVTGSYADGDIIASKTSGNQKAVTGDLILGVVSDTAAFVGNDTFGTDGNSGKETVGMLGRVNTKVDTTNGNISIGDPITASSVAGVGMKQTKAGPTIGKALEAKSSGGVSRIAIQVVPGWYDPDVLLTSPAFSVAGSTDILDQQSDVVTRVGGFQGIIARDATVSGTFKLRSDLFTDLTGNGLTNSSNSLTIQTATSADGLSSTTSNGSGLEVLSSGLTMLQGCSNGQVLKWNETTDVWECSADSTGGTTTLQSAYDATSGNTITTTMGRNIGVTLADVVAGTSFSITQAGSATGLILNDTFGGTNTLLDVRSGGSSNLTINEFGTINTSGNLSTTGTGSVSSAATLNASNGLTMTTGALSMTSTSGIINSTGLTGLTQTLSSGTAVITAPTLNLNTTSTGNTAIGNATGTLALTGGATWSVATTGTTAGLTISGATNTLSNIGNGSLTNSSVTVTAGSGLTDGGSVSLGGTTTLNIGAGSGITVNANDITIDLTASTDALSSTTSSGSGLEVLASGLTLIQGCSDTQILKWNETTDVWECSADQAGGGTATLQIAYDNGNTITSTTGRNIALTLGEVASPTSLSLENQDTAGTNAQRIFNSIASGTLANGLLIEQTGAGTMTSGLNITRTAGTVTNGIIFNGTIGTDITSAAARALTIDSGTIGAISIGTGANAKTITLGNATTTTALNFDTGTGGINFGDNANTKSIDIGGVTNSGADTINISTNSTAADVITVGNSNASTTIAMTGGNDWSISAAGQANFTTTLGSGLTNCTGANQKLQWNSSTNLFSCANENVLQTRSFNDPADVTWAANDTTELFTTPTSRANITPTSSSNKVLVMVSMQIASGGTTDTQAVGAIRSATGATATCASGQVDGDYGAFFTESGTTKTATSVFLHSPATTSNVSYTLCTRSTSVLGNASTKTDATVTLIEVTNSTADLAEIYSTNDKTISSGDIVSLDSSLSAGVKKTSGRYDSSVLGIVSTSPALTIGGTDGEGISAVPVALSGGVPVKVSTENGPIKAGDYLTSSSTPGVAMKATKAGAVIGNAMSGFSGEGIGMVLVFVKNGESSGSNLVDLMPGLDSTSSTYTSQVLANLIQNNVMTTNSVDLSEIMTDRLIAGLEIITPKITTQDIFVTGDATVSGTLVVDTINARKIIGLEVFTDQLSLLSDQVAGVSTSSAQTTEDEGPVQMSILVIITNAIKDIYKNTAEFFGKVIFRGDVNFAGTPTFNSDTVGRALIKQGADEVSIEFKKEYASQPVVNVNANLVGEIKPNEVPQFAVYDVTTKGFKIKLNGEAGSDLSFSWIALAVDGDNVSTSGETPSLTTTPAPTTTTSPTPSVEPSPTVTPSASPSPSPEILTSPSPSPVPTTTPTPVPTESPVPTPIPTTSP